MGIDMDAIGSYERLCAELTKRLSYLCVEYNFPPVDCLLIDVDDGMDIPDLSDFGEVVDI